MLQRNCFFAELQCLCFWSVPKQETHLVYFKACCVWKICKKWIVLVPLAASRGPQGAEGWPSEASGNRSRWWVHLTLQKTDRNKEQEAWLKWKLDGNKTKITTFPVVSQTFRHCYFEEMTLYQILTNIWLPQWDWTKTVKNKTNVLIWKYWLVTGRHFLPVVVACPLFPSDARINIYHNIFH